MLFDQEFLVEHAVSFLPQDVGKYALYMLHHNIEIYELNYFAEKIGCTPTWIERNEVLVVKIVRNLTAL